MKNLGLTLINKFSLFILLTSAAVMTYMLIDLNNTNTHIVQSFIREPLKSAEKELNHFFDPVKNYLLVTRDRAVAKELDYITTKKAVEHFAPLVKHFPQISSIGVASSEGYELDVIPYTKGWFSREIHVEKWGMTALWKKWKEEDPLDYTLINSWWEDIPHDPRERPWFTGAVANMAAGNIYWTEPYTYNTFQEPGITASIAWEDPYDTLTKIIAYDLLITDISLFTTGIKVGETGRLFVFTDDDKIIGLPADEKYQSRQAIKANVLSNVKELEAAEVSAAHRHWETNGKSQSSFKFEIGSEEWWGQVIPYKLGDSNKFFIGVAIPEKEVLVALERTKKIIIAGLGFILVLTVFVLMNYNQAQKAKELLQEQNDKISLQKKIIEEKNRNIIDSITYAKRIQSAILPAPEYMQAHFRNHFVINIPKDIISGDFYWLHSNEEQNKVIWTAADCTGHGVPGSLMSMIGNILLNQIIIEKRILQADIILNMLREEVIKSLKQKGEEHESRDGMDMALCVLNKNNYQLEYAGAYNPLYLIRDGLLQEIKADKQPVGFYMGEERPFIRHVLQLQEDDQVYLFSDGFADQFGGPGASAEAIGGMQKSKKFGNKRFKDLILETHAKPVKEQKQILLNTFENWKGKEEQIDDVLIIGVKV